MVSNQWAIVTVLSRIVSPVCRCVAHLVKRDWFDVNDGTVGLTMQPDLSNEIGRLSGGTECGRLDGRTMTWITMVAFRVEEAKTEETAR